MATNVFAGQYARVLMLHQCPLKVLKACGTRVGRPAEASSHAVDEVTTLQVSTEHFNALVDSLERLSIVRKCRRSAISVQSQFMVLLRVDRAKIDSSLSNSDDCSNVK